MSVIKAGTSIKCMTAAFTGVLTKDKFYTVKEEGLDVFNYVYIIDDLGNLNSFSQVYFEIPYTSPNKCECGSDIALGVNSNFHSTWCNKFSES